MWDLWWKKQLWAGFIRELLFPLPFIPAIAPYSSSSSDGTIGFLLLRLVSGAYTADI
jgi:hypothetical protein